MLQNSEVRKFLNGWKDFEEWKKRNCVIQPNKQGSIEESIEDCKGKYIIRLKESDLAKEFINLKIFEENTFHQ